MSQRTRIYWGIFIFCMIVKYSFIYWSPQRLLPEFPNDEKYFNETLAKLLVPRWPGSIGHVQVSDFIIESLSKLGFYTVRDELFDGMRFTNIVGIMNAEATSFLMLCCHYDSKFLKSSKNYVGATDGAVSCAILLNVVKSLDSYLRGEFRKRRDIGLLLVFFDGHESFEDVDAEFNSLNGSRRFAEVELVSLASIKVVIAFNLIGAPNHIYMSHYENTFELHTHMANIEQELRDLGRLSNCHQLFHKLKDHDSDIEDDHYPFLMEGVPAMHVVPHTFPDVWHTEADTLQNLHFPTIRNMNLIVTQFVYKYLSEHLGNVKSRNN